MRLCLPLLIVACAAGAQPDCQPAPEAVQAALDAVRSSARACGVRHWPAVPPLQPSAVLTATARHYAQELAARDRIDHIGAAGESLRTRLRQGGYAMRLAGENLAGGPDGVEEAMAQWLASPAHCENLMLADFQEYGLACVAGPGQLQRYWVLHLAAPLAPVRSSPGRSP